MYIYIFISITCTNHFYSSTTFTNHVYLLVHNTYKNFSSLQHSFLCTFKGKTIFAGCDGQADSNAFPRTPNEFHQRKLSVVHPIRIRLKNWDDIHPCDSQEAGLTIELFYYTFTLSSGPCALNPFTSHQLNIQSGTTCAADYEGINH